MRVLLIDNQPNIRTAIQFLLDQQPGIWVVGTADTSEVLPEQTNTLRPDIVLISWQLWRKTATGLLTALHAGDISPRVLIFGSRVEEDVISIHYPRALEGFNHASMDFISGATAACEEQHYSLNLITKPLDRNWILGLYDSLRTDAMILMEIRATDWRVELLRTHQLPFVMIGRCNDNTGISYVDIDFERAVITAVEHLVALGHRQSGDFVDAKIEQNHHR